MPEGCAPGRPRLYDWSEEGVAVDGDPTPAAGTVRECPLGCDVLHLAADVPWFACRAITPNYCPFEGEA